MVKTRAAPKWTVGSLSEAHREYVRQLLRRVVKDFGLTALAEAIGCHPNTLKKWMLEGWVPASQAIPLERATELIVSRYITRPDLYPPTEIPPPVPPDAVRLARTAFREAAA